MCQTTIFPPERLSFYFIHPVSDPIPKCVQVLFPLVYVRISWLRHSCQKEPLLHTVYYSSGKFAERQKLACLLDAACGLRILYVLQSGGGKQEHDLNARLVYQVVDALFDR